MNKIKQVLTFIIFLNLFSCASPIIYNSGIKNLEQIEKNIIIGKSNSNDIIGLLGEAIIKEYPDDRNWVYIELVKQRNFLGNTNTLKNNMLIVFFDNKGVVINKELLTLKDVKNLEFVTLETKTLAIDNKISKKFFASMRKRLKSRAEQKTDLE